MTSSRRFAILAINILGFMNAGCSVFLPAHPNSFATKNEQVSVTMLDSRDLAERMFPDDPNDTRTYAEAYDKAFGTDSKTRMIPIAAAATAALGFAVDAVVSQLQTEATHYEAQFGDTRGFSGFWRSTIAPLDVPQLTSVTVAGSGGRLKVGEFYYSVTALDKNGAETLASESVPANVVRNTSSVRLEWQAVSGATEYGVYRHSANEVSHRYISTGTEFIDTGEPGTLTEPPRYLTARSERIEDVYKRDFTKPGFSPQPDTSAKTVTIQKYPPGLTQNYYAVEIKRSVKDGDTVQTAFQTVIGFRPSEDGQMFRVAPLLFWTPKTKAKVLDDSWYTWVIPTWAIGKLFRTPGHEIDSNIDFQIEAVWRGADQQLHSNTVASVPIKFTSYGIENPERLIAPWGPKVSGWLLGVPISYNANGTIAEPTGVADRKYGTFNIKVLVTERDKSNAKQLLEQSATLLKDRKSNIVETITNAVK
jgi:hypothetical protein